MLSDFLIRFIFFRQVKIGEFNKIFCGGNNFWKLRVDPNPRYLCFYSALPDILGYSKEFKTLDPNCLNSITAVFTHLVENTVVT